LTKTPKKYNSAIIGLVLDGEVLEVENDTLKLHLHIDDEQDIATAHFFIYATNYSNETHTGWYVMPEEEDIVQLFFPNHDEKYAYAQSSIRQEITERTLDPLVKYWRTSFGKEIRMNEHEILITSKDNETFIRIRDDEGDEKIGIQVVTPHPVLIQSGSTLNIESEDDMTILTKKNLHIQAEESITILNGGNKMTFVPDEGVSTGTDWDLELLSKGDTTIDSRKELGLKSGDDLKLDSGSNLLERASSRIGLSSNGQSIDLARGGINIKATRIREA